MSSTRPSVPSTDSPSPSRPLPAIAATGVAFLVSYVVARLVLEAPEQPTPLRLAIVLLPVPAFALFLRAFVRGVRAADELERRIQLEALAFAYPLVMLLLLTLGLLQRAITLKFDDWSYLHVCAFLPVLYIAGLALARRRYE